MDATNRRKSQGEPTDLPDSILLPDGPFPVTWRRSQRARRFSLRLSRAGDSVTVTLPMRASAQTGLKFLSEHRGWIAHQLQRRPSPLRFEAGQRVPLNGVSHIIEHVPHGRGGAWIADGQIHVSGSIEFLPRRVRDLLQRLANVQFNERVVQLATTTGLQPKAFAVRDTVSRWGSCTTSGRVMLTWRLIMTPPFVQDYVILHELAHLKHHNHSAAFWALVDHICPYRQEAEQWLKTHGTALMSAS